MNPVRLGIFGAGNMGATHARSLLAGRIQGLELVALADRNPARLAPFPAVAHFEDPRALLAAGRIDAALIATPHYDHTPLGIAALEAGLHVLVEKPVAVHKADVERLIAVAATRPRQIFAARFGTVLLFSAGLVVAMVVLPSLIAPLEFCLLYTSPSPRD